MFFDDDYDDEKYDYDVDDVDEDDDEGNKVVYDKLNYHVISLYYRNDTNHILYYVLNRFVFLS